ncbi:MAG: HemK2/MTQ2 family protein methyltransferase [Candidatus Micrarchaeota archaeon]
MAEVSFEDLVFDVFPGVYAPAEDSFMLAGQIKSLEGDLLDVGTGCGILAIIAKGSKATGVDMNPNAVKNAKANAKKNKSDAKFFVSDLFGNVSGKFDFIAFNPPYLPTSEEERLPRPENLAYDGGESGRDLIDRFLEEFKEHLKDDGKLLMLLSSLSDNGETVEKLGEMGFTCEALAKRHVGLFEELSILRAWRE